MTIESLKSIGITEQDFTESYGSRKVKGFLYVPEGADVSTESIVVAPGWGEGAVALRKAAIQLARRGFAAYTFNHDRTRSALRDPVGHKVEALATVAKLAMAQAPDEKINILGHSEGGITTAELLGGDETGEFRDHIDTAVLVAPAGVVSIAKLHEMVNTAGLYKFKNSPGLSGIMSPKEIVAAALYMRNVPLNLRERHAIGRIDILPHLESILQHRSGENRRTIGLGVVACRYDALFPYAKMMDRLESLKDHSNFQVRDIDTNHLAGFLATDLVLNQFTELRDTLSQSQDDLTSTA